VRVRWFASTARHATVRHETAVVSAHFGACSTMKLLIQIPCLNEAQTLGLAQLRSKGFMSLQHLSVASWAAVFVATGR